MVSRFVQVDVFQRLERIVDKPKYKMTISRLTVDKLGVKLYDKVSAVIAELVANSYDADARTVTIKAPMDELLATKQQGRILDKGYTIEILDDGIGMTPDQVNEFYLKVGGERRKDPKRGEKSKKFGRKVMGNKGVGKLAPFGICEKIEVLTSGGDPVEGTNDEGKAAKGHLTAHVILDRGGILQDNDHDYLPEVGELDGVVRQQTGTHITLKFFSNRRVPEIEDFERQLAQRFGLATANWKTVLVDSLKTKTDPKHSRQVGTFSIQKMENTEILFEAEVKNGEVRQRVVAPNGDLLAELESGFTHDAKFYPVSGWVAYSKEPYKDDLMAGVRIYCRGKIAAQTNIFNRGAGFTGEYDVRSYLVGEMHADWLDETEDLIQTDRRDILWSHELGQAFQDWGQKVVKEIGKRSRQPMKKKTWDRFQEVANLDDRIQKAFPLKEQKEIRDQAKKIAKVVAQSVRKDEIEDKDAVEDLVQLSLMFAPHITLDEKLREAAEAEDSPLGAVTGILKTARVAELSAFGRIAEDRVRVIENIETIKDKPGTLEAEFQNIITEAPWLIDPQWSPITSNQAFTTLKEEFQKYYKRQTGKDLVLVDFAEPNKRADFVLSSENSVVQIIEIKKPDHKLEDEEMERIDKYANLMQKFLNEPDNKEFRKYFTDFHITLVCDGEKLSGTAKRAFESMKKEKLLTHHNWRSFLLRTRKMHEHFLEEAERQKRDAIKS
jgi:hypothetical protein